MKTSALSRPGVPALLILLAALVAACGVAAAPAQAQEKKTGEPLKPPTPNKPDDPPIVWNYLAIVAVVGLAGGAALIPSKRGHQD